jgi:hypothetical protein
MTTDSSRRDILRRGLVVAGLNVVGVRDWMLPALAQSETVVPFTDLPENVRWDTPPDRRLLDIRTIDAPITPADRFATTQQRDLPAVLTENSIRGPD